tara:strand:- start:8 stop:934 length:927 start_codon:yes stop_codon:yes gene_type:complete
MFHALKKNNFFLFGKYVFVNILFNIRKKPIINKYNFLLNILLIFLIRSNHPKRWFLEYKNNNKINFSSLFLDKKNYKNLNIFIGDSHSEFHGRNFSKLDKNINLNLTYWMGPILLMNFLSSQKYTLQVIRFTNLISKKINYQKLNIVLCFGEIDVRCYFYEALKIDKKFNNVEKLLYFIKIKLKKKINFLKRNIKAKNYDIFFNDIQPVTNKKGYGPVTKKNLFLLKDTIKYPVLGTILERVSWRKKFSNYLFKNQKKIGLTFIKQSNAIFDTKNKAMNRKFSPDGTHIHDHNLLYDYQKKIITHPNN